MLREMDISHLRREGTPVRSSSFSRKRHRTAYRTLLATVEGSVGTRVIARARYTLFQMAAGAVRYDLFRQILDMIDDL